MNVWLPLFDAHTCTHILTHSLSLSHHVANPQWTVHDIAGLKKAKIVRVFAGQATCFALTNSDQVYAWGLNNYSQSGLLKDTHGEKIVQPILVPGFSGVVRVSP